VNDGQLLYRSVKRDCNVCPLKMRCWPKEPARKVPRSIYEQARDVARACAKADDYPQSRRDRKKAELFAHLKRILRLVRLRLRGPSGAQFEFTLAAIAQNLRRFAKQAARPPPDKLRALRECGVRRDVVGVGTGASPLGQARRPGA
jgi:DDE family transposase